MVSSMVAADDRLTFSDLQSHLAVKSLTMTSALPLLMKFKVSETVSHSGIDKTM